MDLAPFRRGLADWLDGNYAELRATHSGHPTLDEEMEQFAKVKRALFDNDWGRYGWPEAVGGLGGSPILRAVVGEEIAMRDLCEPGVWSMIEVLAPTIISFAAPEITAWAVPALISGDEQWCQGFSEPDSGSDLASLTCRATPVDGGFLITGQKVWTSFAQYSHRCVLLTRTGTAESAHRGITAFFVDMDSPGITIHPIEIQNGTQEFCEVFYDDVFVPADRMLGSLGDGWKLAMDILPYERSTSFWHRGAYLYHRFGQLVAEVSDRALASPDSGSDPAGTLGEAFQAVMAFRCRSRLTQHRMANGEQLGAETSIDKIMVATSEQQLFDAARDLLPGAIEFDDMPDAQQWRWEYLYSRASTIYGGTAEMQRNIVARRLLDMGVEG